MVLFCFIFFFSRQMHITLYYSNIIYMLYYKWNQLYENKGKCYAVILINIYKYIINYNIIYKMQVFSKMLNNDYITKNDEKNNEISKTEEKLISYNDYFKDKNSITKYKLDKLKRIAKLHKLRISGKKQELITRIEEYFIELNSTIKIQSLFRKYLSNKILRIRGPALRNRNLCVNESDFYTLEPLSEIHHSNFFSYMDASGFIYGFELNSLITMLRKQGTIVNPYNRNKIDFYIVKNIKYLDKFTKVFYKNSNIKLNVENSLTNESQILTNRQNTLLRIQNIRSKNVSTRISELFIEIDLLGNYTQSTWFSNLEKVHYLKLIFDLYEIWNYRSNMSINVRNNICPYFNPFNDGLDSVYAIRHIYMNGRNYSREEMQKHALTIMENIIYTGIDLEYRKLGTLHVLRALTLVSIPARTSLPWLYESIAEMNQL